MPTRMMKDLFSGEIKFIDENDIPGPFGISFNRLRELVECNPEEGWAKRKFNSYAGNGSLTARKGDLLSSPLGSINGCHIYLYHVIWVFHTNGKWAKNELDHIDRNRRNNKVSNLREATRSENQMNKRCQDNNKSGITGVFWHGLYRKWAARIKINSFTIYLGDFDNIEDARQARYDAEDKYFGEFAARHSRPPKTPMKDLFST
jgi:HNH endonuclease